MPRLVQFDDLATGPSPQLPLEAFTARRERLADQVDGTLVVATNPELTYSNDVEHRFRPNSDFWYLTGFAEPEAVLVLGSKTTLFCRQRQPEKEVWTGRRVGVEAAKDALAVDSAYPFDELAERLPSLLAGPVLADVEHHAGVAETLANVTDSEDGARLIAEMRLRKEPREVKMLQKACDIGAAAMREALPLARAGRHEYEVEAQLVSCYRRHGSTGPGYPPIVGTGANAAVLHYVDNRAAIHKRDMVLVDAGCEWGYYNSDITRTVPAAGTWSKMQRELYTLVWEAQQAALREVRPGARMKAVHDAAVRVLAQGFADRGWIDADVDAAIAAQQHRRHYMHGTSHFLGLDVHDVGRYKDPAGDSRVLEPGMVVTVEPGLYLNPDFAPMPAGMHPLGIRIEDDVLVTSDGHRNLLRDLPTDPDGVEGLLQKR